MFGCNTHLLKHIKQAILVWSFRQNIFLGCCPVFVAFSATDEFIVCHCYPPYGMLYWICATLLATLYTFSIDEKNEYDFFRTLVEHTIFRILHRMDCTIHNK